MGDIHTYPTARTRLFMTLEQASAYLQKAQNTLTRPPRNSANKPCRLRETPRATKKFLDVIAVVHNKTKKLRSQLLVALEQATVYLRNITNTLARARTSIVEKARKLQEAGRERENDLPKLLASSCDAIVVMNMELRFVAANGKALDVFGISEKNLTMFSMDAFLPRGQILCFDKNGEPFISRKEWHGECQIRRLDGSLRVAEFIFVANYVPFRHLCMFRNDRKWQHAKRLVA